MSVMNGFRAQLIDKIVGINGHLILYFNDESYKQSDVIEKIETIENGRIIIMTDNTNFRGYWIGTQHFLANMIFYSNLMN